MFSLSVLSRLIPFRDYVYAAAALVAVVWYNVHVHNLEVAYGAKQVTAVNTAVDRASAQALSAAKKLADSLTQDYANHLAQVEDTYEKQLQSADAQHANDLARVRQLAAQGHSGSGSVLSGTGSSASGSDGGPDRTTALGIGAELADALRRDDAALTQCYADRDALTGK